MFFFCFAPGKQVKKNMIFCSTIHLFLDLFLYSLSNHVLTEDIIFREVTPTNCLISRRLLTKTSRAPRWMERYLPKHMASSAYIIEDSIVDPQKRTMTTFTWNISHARLMVPQCPLR